MTVRHLRSGLVLPGPSDGILDVAVIQRADLPSMFGRATGVPSGLASRVLNRWRGKEIHVETNPAQAVLADGEEAGWTPVDVNVVAGAVGVLIPTSGAK